MRSVRIVTNEVSDILPQRHSRNKLFRAYRTALVVAAEPNMLLETATAPLGAWQKIFATGMRENLQLLQVCDGSSRSATGGAICPP